MRDMRAMSLELRPLDFAGSMRADFLCALTPALHVSAHSGKAPSTSEEGLGFGECGVFLLHLGRILVADRA